MMPDLRRAQAEILEYSGGKMGISAVPGSGKTFTLSLLAARLLQEGCIGDNQEVLIVTLVNSAVDNFSNRISEFSRKIGLPPNYGYRVRTLHGLANDIVRERPELAGLPADFRILDEGESTRILRDKVDAWQRGHPEFVEQWVRSDSELFRVADAWSKLLVTIARDFTSQAKDLGFSAQDVLDRTGESATTLFQMAAAIYADYQLALNMRGAVDFDDLIRLALRCLESDPDYLSRLQFRWPFILEDEAQDSSRMQETILRLLSAGSGNWVRVGDPNQAIYETFTTADPKYLVNFLREHDVIPRELPNSGRSARRIIGLANHLIEWVEQEHPVEILRDSLVRPLIQPTDPNDPQPNPEDKPNNIFIDTRLHQSDDEKQKICVNVKNWLENHTEETTAILVASNERGGEIADLLRSMGVQPVEMLKVSQPTRKAAEFLAACFKYFRQPHTPTFLAEVFRLYYQFCNIDQEKTDSSEEKLTIRLIEKCDKLEAFLAPNPGYEWLKSKEIQNLPERNFEILDTFRNLITRWMDAIILPVDQQILTISQDIFSRPADLALAHKLASVMERLSRSNPRWGLQEFSTELNDIASNQTKIAGFSDEDLGFDPDKYKGRVLVTTIHKSKGLEWDRVYILSANNFDFPSMQEGDQYVSEKWFLENKVNLPAEAVAGLTRCAEGDPMAFFSSPGEATMEARRKYCSERLRLLFVGITRARKELIITCNTGKRGDQTLSIPVAELADFIRRDDYDPTA
jgi:DNA helicase-2/ATP-dependent DNA helicase PcrA